MSSSESRPDGAFRRRRAIAGGALIALALVLASVPLRATAASATKGPADTTVEGVVRLVASDTVAQNGNGHTEDVYRKVLVTADGQTYFFKGTKHVPVNKRVRVLGMTTGNDLQPSTLTVLADAPSTLATSGTTRVLVMLVDWSAPDSVTSAGAAQQMFGDSNAWYRDASYGALGQTGDVTPWMSIAGPVNNHCYADMGNVMGQAKNAATSRGYNLANYDNFVVYFPQDTAPGSDCTGYGGWAYVGAPNVWLNGSMDRRVSVHEQGHNYGLYHSHAALCAGAFEGCGYSEYGDPYDAMGGGLGHFNASQKSFLGWLTGRSVDLTSGGTATLVPFETDAVSTQAAMIAATLSRSYWLEYRQPVDHDDVLPPSGADGVLVHLRDPSLGVAGDPNTSLIDARPSDGLSVSTVTLRAGERWVSPEGIQFDTGSVSPSAATVTVTRPRSAPWAPTMGTASAGTGQAILSWTAPAGTGGSPITGYIVTPYVGTQAQPTRRFNSTATRQTVTGLTNGTTYTFKVAAINAIGTGPQSLASNAVKPK